MARRGRGRGGTPDSSGGLDGDGDDGESYSLKEIFANEYNPDDFKYGTRRTTRLRMTTVSYIRPAW